MVHGLQCKLWNLKLNHEKCHFYFKKTLIWPREASAINFIEKCARLYIDKNGGKLAVFKFRKKWWKFVKSGVSSYLMKETNFRVSCGNELLRTLFEFGSSINLRSRRTTSSWICLAHDLVIGPSRGSGLTSLRIVMSSSESVIECTHLAPREYHIVILTVKIIFNKLD